MGVDLGGLRVMWVWVYLYDVGISGVNRPYKTERFRES